MEKNASILVVDDDKEIADLVEIYLLRELTELSSHLTIRRENSAKNTDS